MNDAHPASPAPAPEPTPPSQPAPPATTASAPQRPLLPRLLRSGALALAALAALLALFYWEENWRGRSDWETMRKRLEARQEKLDWAAYIPPAAPDDQNFFEAPHMQDWFAGRGTNELTARLSLSSFAALKSRRGNSNASVMVTELILRSPDTGGTPPGADAPPAELVPLVSLDKAPLSEAIRRLADQAKLKVTVDPQIISGRPGPDGKPAPLTRVTGQWTNVSALSVLMALLCDNNLRWVDDPKSGLPLIKNADPSGPAGGGNAPNRDFVLALIRGAIGPLGEVPDGFPLSGNPLLESPPQRLSIAPDSVPTGNELDHLIPGAHMLRIEPAGNSLQVWLNVAPVAAADYLAWSDQFSPEFDAIRATVKRPFARLDGDYRQPYRIPAFNLTAAETAASRLATRAGAFLMRGQPADALQELTLLNDLRGCLEGKPAGNPTTWSGAMADATVSGLYVETIAYGLRLRVWRDSELAALEDQLSRVDLVSPVWRAMESERAAGCHLLDTGSRSEMAQLFKSEGGALSFWQKLRSPARMTLKLMPRGWVDQNMARLAVLDQKMIDSVDPAQGLIRPRQVEAAGDQIGANLLSHRHSPWWFMAKNMISPVTAPLKSAAHAQTAANQALVACALERCRLARGEYPASLHDLVPLFIPLLPPDPVNGQPLKYRPDGPERFVLYSVGWDEKDDNGTPVDDKGKGDWVWGLF